VNDRQWREVARPISWDLAAVLAEYGTLRLDSEALRAASREICKEALRRMLSEAGVAGSRRRAV
jgi:hypothetical protein